MNYYVSFFLVLFNFAVDGQVLLCQNTNNLACQCEMSDGLIDIAPVGRTNGIRFENYKSTNPPDDFIYSYNPCHPFSKLTCVDSAACQTKGTSESYNLATQSSASWSKCATDPSLNCITYTATQDLTLRTTTVILTCGTTDQDTFSVDGEDSSEKNTYVYRLTSKCACPGGCTSSGGNSGLSTGSIMCITFSVLFVVYVTAGITFNVVKRGATGKEVIPNVDFWIDFPVLVKEGTVYFISLFKKGGGGYSTMD